MKKLLTCIAMGFATTSYAVTPLWMRGCDRCRRRQIAKAQHDHQRYCYMDHLEW